MRKGIIFVDVSKCMGCKRCYIACGIAHSPSGNLVEIVIKPELAYPSVEFRPVGGRVVPIECRHCEGAPCAIACPTGAIKRHGEGEPVLIDDDLCVGCKSCRVACPYGAIRVSERTGQIYKCNFCIKRTSQGGIPHCVEACPTGCLSYETMSDLIGEAGEKRFEEFFTSTSNS